VERASIEEQHLPVLSYMGGHEPKYYMEGMEVMNRSTKYYMEGMEGMNLSTTWRA
jgi:hypothetical protein